MQIQVFFLLSTCQWKKNVFHSHFQEIARKHTWQFLSKFPLSVVTFLEICAQDFSFRMKAFPLAHLFRNIWRSNLLCRILRSANHYHPHQEPITSLQLPYIAVTAFSQTDLFLVWIYLEFRSPQEPHWSIAVTSTDWCWHVDMFKWGRIVLSLPRRAHVDWNTYYQTKTHILRVWTLLRNNIKPTIPLVAFPV